MNKFRVMRWLLLAVLTVLLAFGSTAYAFSDTQGHPARESIDVLAKAGIVNGIDEKRFAPNGHVTAAQGVQLIVKGLKLNIDNMRFVKEPKASDYFENVPNDAWYSTAFAIAHLNGLPIPKDIDPSKALTREQFAHWLMEGIAMTGEYAFIEIFLMIADVDEIDRNYMNSIQKLLVAKIVKLEENQKFRPKQELTRGQAAIWVDRAIRFIHDQKQSRPDEPAQPDDEVSMNIERSPME